MKKGRTLELVVFSLERVLSSRTGVMVHSPYKAIDRTTGKHREHDVVIVQDTHHKIIFALECRDRARPVTVPEVEGFWKKCQETGIHKGAIVSPKGFCKTAKEKAKALQIECLSIEQVEAFNWFDCSSLKILKPRIVKQNWLFIPETDIFPKPTDFLIFDAEGNQVTPSALEANVIRALERLPNLKSTPGVHPVNIRFDMRECHLLDKATGTKHRLKHANTYVEVEVVTEDVVVKKVRYKHHEGASHIVEAAIASVKAGAFGGEIIVLNNDGGIQVSYIPAGLSQ